MSAFGEQQLVLHLLNKDSLRTLVREGLPEECVPTEEIRDIYLWAMDRYYRGGMTLAPSKDLMLKEFDEVIEEHEIDLEDDPQETIEGVIDDLKGSFIHALAVDFNRRLAKDMADANTSEKIEVLNEYATELVRLASDVESREYRVDAREGLGDRLLAYDARSEDHSLVDGARFGIREIDDYTRGIHPGELCVVAAGPKVGKSFFSVLVALKEWLSGRSVALFSLENSIEMTQDRLAIFLTGTNAEGWGSGSLDQEERDRVAKYIEDARNFETPLHLLRPAPGGRTVDSLVRQAQILEVDTLIIDQLSHLEPTKRFPGRPDLEVGDIVFTLKNLISTGRYRMPCFLFHQINREGVKAADKENMLKMEHLAETAIVERTADWVFGIHRSDAERAMNRAKFQTLAARREVPQHFLLNWNVSQGQITYNGIWRPPVS